MKPTDYVVFVAWSEEDERYIAVVPDLPGCMADGANDQEALLNARSTIQSWIEVATGLDRDIPTPRDLKKLEFDAAQEHQEFQKGLHEHIQSATQAAVQSALTQIIPEIIKSIQSNFGLSQGYSKAAFITCGNTFGGRGSIVFQQRHLPLPEEAQI